jgi:DNA adenine methylase
MKPPISYYGGKQGLVPEILKLIPDHKQYVEPFTGGAAVYFAKPPSEAEVINDLDNRLVNFYRVLKNKEKFLKLQQMVEATLHSESDYRRAGEILHNGLKSEVEYAWALWIQTNLSFSNILGGSFAFGNDDRCCNVTNNKKKAFDFRYYHRLERTEIFCRDAVNLIKLKDTPYTFFYCDPPYVSSDCGHYKGYTLDDFRELLEVLSNIQGKFLMSSYPENILMEFRDRFSWGVKDIKKQVFVTGKRQSTKYKTECLTWNYELKKVQEPLFL